MAGNLSFNSFINSGHIFIWEWATKPNKREQASFLTEAQDVATKNYVDTNPNSDIGGKTMALDLKNLEKNNK